MAGYECIRALEQSWNGMRGKKQPWYVLVHPGVDFVADVDLALDLVYTSSPQPWVILCVGFLCLVRRWAEYDALCHEDLVKSHD
jgi:hypothetical protein